jgi:DEK C terminal domain
MASSFSKEELRKEINSENSTNLTIYVFLPKIFWIPIYEIFYLFILVILQHADLEKTSSKEVRTQLQDKLKADFSSRKKELE